MSSQDPPSQRTRPGRAGVAFLLGLAIGGFSVYYLLWRTGALAPSHLSARRPLFDLIGSRPTPTPTPEETPTPPPALAPSPVLPSIAPEETTTPTPGAP